MISSTLCYILQDGKYLLLHRVKKAKDPNAGKWVGVGGKLERGETADECVIREVLEETGLTLTGYERIGLVKFVSDTYESEDMYLYQGLSYTGRLRDDCPEGELRWIPVEDVPGLPIWEGDRYFLEAMQKGRRNINMTLRYEGERLVEVKDDSTETEVDFSSLIRSKHGFSTRIGGVSEGIFHSLNLGRNRGDVPERVNENWRRFLKKCRIDKTDVVRGKQVHGNYVHVVVREEHSNLGITEGSMEADGFVTNQPGIPIAVFTADCVPVLLEDAKHGVIAAVHSGWRGTVADIEGQVIKRMQEAGADVRNIRIALGPAIDKCCFEVGPEVIVAVEELLGQAATSLYTPRGNKYMLDLRGVIRERFLQLGIPEDHIERVGGCTGCHPDRYWSHRYTNGERGSQAAVIMLS